MDRFDRIFQFHRILRAARTPVSRKRFEEECECTRATVARTLADMRDYLNAPIHYDNRRNGYLYAQTPDQPMYELPGLWFNADEAVALMTCHELLGNLQPGLLGPAIEPLRERLQKILDSRQGGGGQLARRLRVLGISRKAPSADVFGPLSSSLTLRRRLRFDYDGRARGERSAREVSPQRLVRYRDNWYLDAWDHGKDALRMFAVERMHEVQTLEAKAREVQDAELDAVLAAGYGIFSGPVVGTAVLRFSPHRARWVADELWHPDQASRWLDDGRYELSVPYSDQRELLMDVLKHGEACEVVAPAALRKAAAAALQAALALYAPKAAHRPR